MRDGSVTRSPLLPVALALVPPSVTGTELAGRAASVGADLQPGVADEVLTSLARMGLIRATRRDDDGVRYVLTSLGTRTVESGLDAVAVPLEELERLRSDLFATISHELRTPLTAIRTSVGLLLDPSTEPTDEQRRALLASIERNSERMQRLIGDILELSRFRAGKVSLQLRRFPAVVLAEDVIAAVAPLAAERGQHLELDVAVPDDHEVFGDHRRLEGALLNLVANAQRFSPDDGTVTVSVERRDDCTAWGVTDRGPGIAEPDQARLFERFFVGRNDRTGKQDGVGLGLPTALAVAQAHGGTIEVISALGEGSTFTLVVPTVATEDGP